MQTLRQYAVEIDEILADIESESIGLGLPQSEFIELGNATKRVIDLQIALRELLVKAQAMKKIVDTRRREQLVELGFLPR